MTDDRRDEGLKDRAAADELASGSPNTQHIAKGDEQMFRQYVPDKSENANKIHSDDVATLSKGMPQDPDDGMIWNPADAQNLIKAINSGDQRDFK